MQITRTMLQAKNISASEISEQINANILSSNQGINALLAYDHLKMRKQAQQAELLLSQNNQPALAGIPFAVSDNICTADLVTTCGSKMLAKYLPPQTAYAVERIQAKGGVLVGKCNLDEFALGNDTLNSAFGQSRNPLDPTRSAGGSAGGAAAAVAADMALFALVADTGGAIRRSGSFCGLTGLKPTYGRISRRGLISISALSQIGVLAKDAIDTAHAFMALDYPDKGDNTARADYTVLRRKNASDLQVALDRLSKGKRSDDFHLRGLRIAYPSFQQMILEPEIESILTKTIKELEKQGAICVELDDNLYEGNVAAYYLLTAAEANLNLARFDGLRYGYSEQPVQGADFIDYISKNRQAAFDGEVKRRLLLGALTFNANNYEQRFLRAVQVKEKIKSLYATILDQVDFVLEPVSRASTPLLSDIGPGQSKQTNPLQDYMSSLYTVNTALTGLPALVFPCGYAHNNLPLGLQLTGKAFSDYDLLKTVISFQLKTDYHRRKKENKYL